MKTKKIIAIEYVFGIHPITELLKAKKRKILKVYALEQESPLLRAIYARWTHVEIHRRSREDLTNMVSSSDHQGIVAIATPFQFRAKPFDPEQHRALVMLDGIQDPRNLGAILRSVYCTGFQGVILTKKSSAPISPVCLKASAGLAEHLDIYQVPSALAGVQELQKSNYNVYVSALTKQAVSAAQIDYQMPLCLVIGSEGKGVSPELLNKGTVIRLPQKTADISYNASVAAGILMFLIAAKNNNIF